MNSPLIPSPEGPNNTSDHTPVGDSAAPKERNRALEGCLGIATLVLLVYHSNQTNRGFYAIDALMFIAAFVLTASLIREQTLTGRIHLSSYYQRTFKRYVPAALAMLAVTSLLIFLFGNTHEQQKSFPTVLATLGQVANWQQLFSGVPNWDNTTKIRPLALMWTLSLAGQFLALLPILSQALWTLAKKKLGIFTLLLFSLTVAAASVSPMLAASHTTERLYLGSDAHALPLVAGSFFAALTAWIQKHPLAVNKTRKAIERAAILWTSLSLVGIALIAVEHQLNESYEYALNYRSGLIVVCLGLGILCQSLSMRPNFLQPILGFAPFSSLGRLNYEIFILHLPVSWILHTVFPTLAPISLLTYGGIFTIMLSAIAHFRITQAPAHQPWYALKTNNWPLICLAIALFIACAGVVIY
ncbi:acyltransferase family protein [Paeniglutamicibacter sp. NPDC012692]|uniref:acyltransferase family protein n=1 Tax=Paeniglutamicibacter sp. NPDC012692 TaxID=3364388 RepID=UPI0036A28CF0